MNKLTSLSILIEELCLFFKKFVVYYLKHPQLYAATKKWAEYLSQVPRVKGSYPVCPMSQTDKNLHLVHPCLIPSIYGTEHLGWFYVDEV